MKNDMAALNNYLFEQIERLNDDDLAPDDLDKEIKRSKAVTEVAKTIIANGTLAVSIKKHLDTYGNGDDITIPLLGDKYEGK